MVGWAIAVHGGAGVDPNLPTERQEQAKLLLTRCLNLGISALQSSAAAIDVVELVVRELETDPIFNSGRGSALTEKGTVEMEASIMDGPGRRCGAVSGLTTVKNPVSLARLVMDKSPHSYLAFSGAEDFAKQMGVEREENDYFITEENVGMLKVAKEANSIVFDYRIPTTGYESCGVGVESPIRMNGLPISVYAPETVGCVVVDSQGRCAAATSTGGLMNKRTGRIGEVAAVMEYKGLGLQEAVDFVIKERLDEGQAGLIAVSKTGEVAYGFNCVGMFRGCASEDGFMEVGIWE
ncbi:putative asparaginase [Helianthus debilis subsp. tardiflorus]